MKTHRDDEKLQAGQKNPAVTMRWHMGRSTRLEYWICVAALLGASYLFDYLGVRNSALAVPWIIVYARRLHDLGWSAWWTAAVMLFTAIPIVVLWGLGGEYTAAINGLLLDKPVDASYSENLAAIMVLLTIVGGCAAYTLALGLLPGKPEANKYGPAPGSHAQKEEEVF